MIKKVSVGAAIAILAALELTASAVCAKELKVISDKSVGGFGHVESVAYDAREKVFYAGDFGPELKPADKDGKGKITKISLDGKILEERVFPAAGQTMNKPKGIWIHGTRLWVTDIDAMWEFDLKSKQGKRIDLPGITFANDPAVIGDTLYVSDNRSDKLARVEPADFLGAKKEPKVTIVFSGKGVFPNGLWPGRNGALLMVGFQGKDKPQAIYRMALGKDPQAISQPIGMLDGLYRLSNGDILATDWVSGALFQWNAKMGKKDLATGFKGPADFCVVPNKAGLLVVVPDLVKGELRFVQLGK